MHEPTSRIIPQESFDPASADEWDSLRELGHRMLDDMLAAMRTLPERPVWTETPADVRQALLTEPVPVDGVGREEAYRHFRERVLPYPNGNWHPRFFGWVQGNGTPFGMLADMLGAGLNAHLGGFNQAPALVEHQTIAWFAELFGMPGASGMMVTGGSMANALGLAAARFAKGRELGRDTRRDGVQQWPGDAPRAPMVFYGSAETHGWARKATQWLGLGDRAYRQVPTDAGHRIDLDALASQVRDDRLLGLEPFCVIGTAGTVNIGATDDLVALAAFAAEQRLWFHVDGAFGALAYLSDALRPRVRGLELADSIGFDLHKWGSLPFDCACALVRDPQIQTDAFATQAHYLRPALRGVSAGGTTFSDRGLDLTRNFKALKVWLSLKADGVGKLARIIEQNVAQAAYFATLVDAHPELQCMAPVPLNIVCFRYRSADADEASHDALNLELMIRLQERGIAVLSSTQIDGRFALRMANVNHRSTTTDFERIAGSVVEIGREIVTERALTGALRGTS